MAKKAKKKANGEHTIYFDKNRSCWVGQITIGHDENGNRKRRTVYGKTKSEIRDKLKKIESELITGIYLEPDKITIEIMGKQIQDEKKNIGEITGNTYYRNMETLKRLAPIYNTPIQDATETQLKGFLLSEQSYSNSTIKKDYQMLNMIFREAVEREIIRKNPMSRIKCPKSTQEPKKIRSLTKEEQAKLTQVLLSEDVNYSEQMLISLYTGMRMGEVNALKVEDVNLTFGTIHIHRTITRGQRGEAILKNSPKTESGDRKIRIPNDDIKSLLKDCIGDRSSGLIFTKNDRMITTSQVNLQYLRALKKYDIVDKSINESVKGRVDLHSLRHTFGTRAVEAGVDYKVLCSIMGHSDIKVTINTYADATEDFKTEGMEKLDRYMKSQGLGLVSDQVGQLAREA